MITYSKMTSEIKERIAENFSAVVVRHLHPDEEGGLTFVALDGMRPVRVISSFMQDLPAPSHPYVEGPGLCPMPGHNLSARTGC